jgi:DNA-binding MarR family transcriptional regulator
MALKSSVRRSATGPSRRSKAAPMPMPAAHDNEPVHFDRLVYERVRLGIMSALAVRDVLSFNELKSLFDVSDGNLSAHARKLEEAKYLTCTKSFEDRRPRSVYRLTQLGRDALNRYLDHVEAVIKATRR